MSESKHTPGPWSLKSRNNPHEWDVVKFDTLSSDDPWFVAAVFDGAEGRASLDNARLIASAPDLLEALAECEDYFDQRADADCDQDGFIPNKEMQMLVMVREALAKAEGR